MAGESILTNDKFNEIIKDSCSASKENMKQEVSRTTDPVMPSTPVHANKTQTDFQGTPHYQTGTNDRQVSMCLSGGQSPMLSQSPFSQGHRTMVIICSLMSVNTIQLKLSWNVLLCLRLV